MTDDTKPESASERVAYLATCSIRDYADPTEPNLYPDKFTAFVRKSAYDRQEKTISDMRAVIEAVYQDLGAGGVSPGTYNRIIQMRAGVQK